MDQKEPDQNDIVRGLDYVLYVQPKLKLHI